jgi:hypothetical protein
MLIGLTDDVHIGCTDYSHKCRADFSAAFCATPFGRVAIRVQESLACWVMYSILLLPGAT